MAEKDGAPTPATAERCLAARCDGSAPEDWADHDESAAPLGRKLAALSEATWIPRQRRAAWYVLAKDGGPAVRHHRGDGTHEAFLPPCCSSIHFEQPI